MKQIEKEKARLFKLYAGKHCGIKEPYNCTKYLDGGVCDCEMMAHIKALQNIVLPEDFRRYSIKNFDGQDADGNPVLPAQVAKLAKEQVSEFCWGKIPLTKLNGMSQSDLLKQSILKNRIDNGYNVVIHGSSGRKIVRDEGDIRNVATRPVGRTFVASILTREAINMRLTKGGFKYIYEWVEFSTLVDALKNDPEAATDYLGTSWLVVDNVTDNLLAASKNAKAYLQGHIDPFFFHRMNNNLSTVLVFKFDVDQNLSYIQEAFGVAIAKLVSSKKTYKIHLTDNQ